jgi:hypothetical protein
MDLLDLAHELRSRLGPHSAPLGYLRGKALMRDVLVTERGLSELEAEDIIDTMEMNGFLHFLGNPSDRSVADAPWAIEPHEEASGRQEPSIEVKPPEAGQVVEISDEEG